MAKLGEMEGRALLVGSPGKDLQGVDHDVACMAEMLRGRKLAVEICTGAQATRAGILAAYGRLIAGVRQGQAAVFYYSGHGFHAFKEKESRAWQGIAPYDLGETTTADFRGITSWELSILQAKLTRRTTNVTVILDCCYASQMSREAAVHGAVPKTLPHPVRLGFDAHLRALRAQYGAAFDEVDPISNRHAVRLVACGQTECAYEYRGAGGIHRSAFTEALLEVLLEVRGVPVSWAAIEGAIRARVARRFPTQRPDIEGPTSRRPFSLERGGVGESVTIAATPNGFQIGAGRLMGVMPGDLYGVMPDGPPTYREAGAIAEVQIVETSATTARAELRGWRNGHTAIPRGSFAVPVEKVAVRRAVRLEVPASAREAVVAALAATRALRPAEPDEAPVLATLRLDEGELTIEDPIGPLFPAAPFPAQLPGTVQNLVNLGVAEGLRELEGEQGVLARELEIEWGTVDRGQMRTMPDRGGSLGLRDRIYVRVKSLAKRPLYAHVFNIGLRGAIKLLTHYAPSGVELTREAPELVLGRRNEGSLLGYRIGWPAGLPRETGPRMDEIVVIVTSTPASLRSLETMEHVAASRGAATLEGYYMVRLCYLLHPRDEVMAEPPPSNGSA